MRTGDNGIAATEFVTGMVGPQMFGFAIDRVRDVFVPESITAVPRAPAEIAGLINLRGRIVTLIDLHARLGIDAVAGRRNAMAIGIDHRRESFGLLIDHVGQVVKVERDAWERAPDNLDPRWSAICLGVCRTGDALMLAFDIDRILDERLPSRAA